VHVVEAQELLGSQQPSIGGTPAQGTLVSGPGDAAGGRQFERPPLVASTVARMRTWTTSGSGCSNHWASKIGMLSSSATFAPTETAARNPKTAVL